MAVIERVIDDLDGTEFAEGEGETVTFALDGQTYEIDLTTKNAAALHKAFEKYVEKARPVTRATGRAARNPESAAIREWAKGQGYEVPERGRLPQEVVDAYESAKAEAAVEKPEANGKPAKKAVPAPAGK